MRLKNNIKLEHVCFISYAVDFETGFVSQQTVKCPRRNIQQFVVFGLRFFLQPILVPHCSFQFLLGF